MAQTKKTNQPKLNAKEQAILRQIDPIITVKEARKLLGVKYENLPDKKIEEIIYRMTEFSSRVIDCQIVLQNIKAGV